MTTATLPQTPVTIASRWLEPLIFPCTLIPEGMPGLLEIASPTKRGMVRATYRVQPVWDRKQVVGWQLTHTGTDQVYAIDHLSWGWSQASCECGQNVWRQKRCKHSVALESSLREIGIVS